MQPDSVLCLPCSSHHKYLARRFGLRLMNWEYNNLRSRRRTASLSRCMIFVCAPSKAKDDVYPGIFCRFFQMHNFSLNEDFVSCTCRVAGPQPRGFSVLQQSDGQYHSPTRRDGLSQVSLPSHKCLASATAVYEFHRQSYALPVGCPKWNMWNGIE